MATHGGSALSFQQVTVSTTPVALVLGAGNPTRCILNVQTSGIRFRWDGVDPTTTIGHFLQAAGGPVDMTRFITITGAAALANFRMIREGVGDATVAYTLEA
jgi:hypothetical protein